MTIFLVWVGLSIVAGIIAQARGRGAIEAFIVSILLSPLIGIVIALTMKSGDAIARQRAGRGLPDTQYRKCPQCAEVIQREAKVCRYCHAPVGA